MKIGKRPVVGIGHGTGRKFHSFSESQIMQLKTKHMKKRSETKMMWAVRAYNEWRNTRLNDIINFDNNIFEADLNNLSMLTKRKA